MESTGIYWKSPYAALEAAGIRATVVNARHVKQVPGRKTDVGDAQWLATLARAGLLRGSFVPPAKLRELRLIARQRQKLVGLLSSEKNRMHKVLTDAGIRLGVVVSDIHGQSARAMIKCLLAGQPPEAVLKLASRRLKASREELHDALQGELCAFGNAATPPRNRAHAARARGQSSFWRMLGRARRAAEPCRSATQSGAASASAWASASV